jgi:hypothetical protein
VISLVSARRGAALPVEIISPVGFEEFFTSCARLSGPHGVEFGWSVTSTLVQHLELFF